MLLGTILTRLNDDADAAAALEALGDIVLLSEVNAMGALHDEGPGQYAAGATRRFAALASDEDWLALVTAIEKSDDPARTTLECMVRWSLAKDSQLEADLRMASGEASSAGSCSCGGDGSCKPRT